MKNTKIEKTPQENHSESLPYHTPKLITYGELKQLTRAEPAA